METRAWVSGNNENKNKSLLEIEIADIFARLSPEGKIAIIERARRFQAFEDGGPSPGESVGSLPIG
jgi:hypothetical protein